MDGRPGGGGASLALVLALLVPRLVVTPLLVLPLLLLPLALLLEEASSRVACAGGAGGSGWTQRQSAVPRVVFFWWRH